MKFIPVLLLMITPALATSDTGNNACEGTKATYPVIPPFFLCLNEEECSNIGEPGLAEECEVDETEESLPPFGAITRRECRCSEADDTNCCDLVQYQFPTAPNAYAAEGECGQGECPFTGDCTLYAVTQFYTVAKCAGELGDPHPGPQ